MSAVATRRLIDDATLLSELTGLIYDAAADPSVWPRFLERLRELLELHSINVAMANVSPNGTVDTIPLSAGLTPSVLHDYETRYASIDPHRARAIRLPVGTVTLSSALMPDEDFVRSEYYNDFYSPAGMRHGLLSVLYREGGAASGIILQRGHGQEPFGLEEVAFLRMLTPHLQRSRALAGRLGTLASNERILADVLDQLPTGLIFLDASGRVLRANARGETILRERDGLDVFQGQLVAARPRDTRRLQGLIAAACGMEGVGPEPMSLRLDRPSGRRFLEMMACPVDATSEAWSKGLAAAFIVVSDGEAELAGAAQRLRELYALSDAEAKLAVAIARGRTLKEWAAERDVSVETVRWQLKQVFAKTGASRQPDLMRLVLLGPALAG